MTLNTKTAKLKKYKDNHKNLEVKRQLESEINDDVESLLKQVEFEDGLPEGIIFPVNNTIVVDELRERNASQEKRIHKADETIRKLEESNRNLLESNRNLHESNRNLHESNRNLHESNREQDRLIKNLEKKIDDLSKEIKKLLKK
jgi:myosin heavy subunit